MSATLWKFKPSFPPDGWVEHDPREIRASLSAVTAETLAQANLDAAVLAAIGRSRNVSPWSNPRRRISGLGGEKKIF